MHRLIHSPLSLTIRYKAFSQAYTLASVGQSFQVYKEVCLSKVRLPSELWHTNYINVCEAHLLAHVESKSPLPWKNRRLYDAAELGWFPAAMTRSDGLHYSEWVSAMFSFTGRRSGPGLDPFKGIVLELHEVSSQKLLSELAASLYTGRLETDAFKVTEQLRIADYLRVSHSSARM